MPVAAVVPDCPRSLQIDADDIEIDIDAISPAAFWEVDSFVKAAKEAAKSKSAKRKA
jgi:hypothetical protein